jgi:hypothetical protein
MECVQRECLQKIYTTASITGAMPLHLTIWRPAEVWHHLGALRILR